MEQNPYQSPQADKPLKRAQIVKRGVGLGAILLLTPPAFFLAVFTSCAASFAGSPVLTVVFLAIPPAALAGMLWAADHVRERREGDQNFSRFRKTLYATPVVVLVASGIGLGCAVLAYGMRSEERRVGYGRGESKGGE